jgi:hypothetical protein
MEAALTLWLNIATFLVFVGAAIYITLGPYMTRDE